MLSPETLAAYRAMTPEERLKITFELMDQSSKWLLHGTPEQVDRKFKRLEMQNDERNQRMLEAFAFSMRTKPSQ